MSAGGVPGLCPKHRTGLAAHPSLHQCTGFLGGWAETLETEFRCDLHAAESVRSALEGTYWVRVRPVEFRPPSSKCTGKHLLFAFLSSFLLKSKKLLCLPLLMTAAVVPTTDCIRETSPNHLFDVTQLLMTLAFDVLVITILKSTTIVNVLIKSYRRALFYIKLLHQVPTNQAKIKMESFTLKFCHQAAKNPFIRSKKSRLEKYQLNFPNRTVQLTCQFIPTQMK